MSLNSLPSIQEVLVPLGERSYSVFVGKGAVSHIHRLLPQSAKRAVVVTQSGIAAIPDLEIPTLTIHIPAGEEHKSLSTIEDLCRQFAQFGLTRNDVVIGVGGGLVTDVAGFAASSYHRGTAVVLFSNINRKCLLICHMNRLLAEGNQSFFLFSEMD